MKNLVRLILPVLIAALLSACATRPSSTPVPDEQSEYTLGVGDAVRVTVFGQEQMTGEYKVEANGMISFPLIQDVAAAGTTTTELEKAIAARLSPDYLVDPRVSVEVLAYRSVYVLGEVNNPGKFEYVPNLTVLQAIAIAGGYTYRADEDGADVTRHVKGALKTFPVDTQTLIKPGDTIVVGRRWF